MKLVCPHEPALIDRLVGRSICVRVDAAKDVAVAAADVRRRNTLSCVICDLSIPLADVEIGDDAVPIALRVPSVGRFRNIARKVGGLRKLDLRIYLPCDAGNLTAARTLASLGIPVCLEFDDKPDWEALADLMTYALLGLVPHAPVDPFQTIASGYQKAARGEDWGRVFFDDPSRYLHLDADGRIALSRRDLEAGRFVTGDLAKLDSPLVKNAIEERNEAWRTLFAENHVCARCKAWRICHARFRDGAPDGCADFFAEMADVIERRKPAAAVVTWQP